MGIALVLVSRLADRIPARPMILVGLAFTATGLVIYAHVGAHTSIVLLSAAALVSGLGIGSALVPAMAGAYAGLPREAVSRATSAIRVIQQLGGSLGIAILAVVLRRQITDQTAGAGHADPGSLATAYGHTFWWALALTAVALVPTLLLPRPRSATSSTSTSASAEPAGAV
jgi:MFS family permease